MPTLNLSLLDDELELRGSTRSPRRRPPPREREYQPPRMPKDILSEQSDEFKKTQEYRVLSGESGVNIFSLNQSAAEAKENIMTKRNQKNNVIPRAIDGVKTTKANVKSPTIAIVPTANGILAVEVPVVDSPVVEALVAQAQVIQAVTQPEPAMKPEQPPVTVKSEESTTQAQEQKTTVPETTNEEKEITMIVKKANSLLQAPAELGFFAQTSDAMKDIFKQITPPVTGFPGIKHINDTTRKEALRRSAIPGFLMYINNLASKKTKFERTEGVMTLTGVLPSGGSVCAAVGPTIDYHRGYSLNLAFTFESDLKTYKEEFPDTSINEMMIESFMNGMEYLFTQVIEHDHVYGTVAVEHQADSVV